ncbi:hypothetical protein HS7_02560 [Sulfolobales archaeon HS-7]|nr:hypothetical protein HS7_02560 [Sulfolobales archaeon HS-7]
MSPNKRKEALQNVMNTLKCVKFNLRNVILLFEQEGDDTVTQEYESLKIIIECKLGKSITEVIYNDDISEGLKGVLEQAHKMK